MRCVEMKLFFPKNKNQVFIFVACLFVFSLQANQANAHDKWIVLGNTGWVSGDERLTLTMPSVLHPDLRVTSSAAEDLQWIDMQVPFTLGETIKGIYLCYKTPSEGSFISQIRLAEYLIPGTATVHHDDPTDLVSSEGSCYLSPVNNYRPGGSVNLSLRLNFANAGDRIDLGALGVLIGSLDEDDDDHDDD